MGWPVRSRFAQLVRTWYERKLRTFTRTVHALPRFDESTHESRISDQYAHAREAEG